MRSLVIGASAGLGRAVAETLAANGHSLFLISSDERDIHAQAADLAIRFGVRVYGERDDLTNLDIASLRQRVHAELGTVQNLFYIAGRSVSDSGPIDDKLVTSLVDVNFTSAVRIVNAFLDDLSRNGGNLVGAGSVSASRGRRVNSIYAAAKAGLDIYFAAMRHYLAGSQCKVQFYRLGYIETKMTFGQRLMFPALKPDDGAKVIVGNLGRDLGSVYLPRWWWGITKVIVMLPWVLFRRLSI